MKGDILSGRSVTKTVGTTAVGGFCQFCGKPFIPPFTKRLRFCPDDNGRCRQAYHRATTGKSAKAGTKRVKAAIPINAKRGLPKTAADRAWLLHEADVFIAGVCSVGVIECYHHKYGRGVIDLHRHVAQVKAGRGPSRAKKRLLPWVEPVWHYREDLGCEVLIPPGTWRCLFNKPKKWRYISAPELYLLAWHPGREPKHLSWIHREDRIRVRRGRTIHVDFNKVGIHLDENGSYVLTRESPVDIVRDTLIEFTEDTGKHNDEKPTEIIPLEDFDSTDEHGSKGKNGSKR